MERFFLCCLVGVGLSLPAQAGELDQEAAPAGQSTRTAKAPVLNAKAVVGSEMDKEAPQQSWRRGGWGWGSCSPGFGYSCYRPYGGYSCYSPYCGYSCYSPYCGYSCYSPYCGYSFGYSCSPSVAYYAPCYTGGYGSYCYGGW